MSRWEVISSELRKARTAHTCIWCGQTIEPGTLYRYERVRGPDGMEFNPWHLECDEAHREVCRLSGEDEFTIAHAATYTMPFLLITAHPAAIFVILITHFVIDRWRLARYVVWAKNWMGYGNRPWAECTATGYPPDRPAWLTVWLLIIADNVLHVLCNALAIAYL